MKKQALVITTLLIQSFSLGLLAKDAGVKNHTPKSLGALQQDTRPNVVNLESKEFENGLNSLKLAQIGLKSSAVESTQYFKSADVPKHMIDLLRKELPLTLSAWSLVSRSGLYSSKSISFIKNVWGKGFKNLAEVKAARKTVETFDSTTERAPWLFEIGLGLLLFDQPKDAIQVFRRIRNASDGGGIVTDRLNLALARAYFQNKQYDSAIEEYKKIGQDSDYWFEALEEQAWSYIQKKEPQRSLGHLKTITAEVFESAVGPEPYFLNAYILMKLCDYKEVFNQLNRFKKVFKERAVNMQNLAKSGSTEQSDKALQGFLTTGTWKGAGSDLKYLPRLFYRNELLVRTISWSRALEKELSAVEALVAQAGSSGQPVQEWLTVKRKLIETIKKSQYQLTDSALKQKIKDLAVEESREISNILQKMHILEAETIQRLFSYQQKQANIEGKYEDKINKSGDVLVFEATDEVWLDELDKYQVEVKGCPTKKEISK